jgi:hypothetical protein
MNESRDIFDVLSTYFVNCYWNELFKHANDALIQQQFNSIGDSYCEMVERYRRAFTDYNPKERNHNYERILKDIHNSYNFYFRSNSSYTDFIDVLSKQFIPRDIYASLPRQDRRKDEMVKRVLCKVVNAFSLFTVTEGLSTVTQGRGQRAKDNMMAWKAKGIELFNKERSELYARAMAEKTGVDPNKKEGISREAFEKMQGKIKELIMEKAELRKQLNKYGQYINLLKRRVAELEKEKAQTVVVADPMPRRRVALPKQTAVVAAMDSSVDEDEDEEEEEPLPRINDPNEKDQSPNDTLAGVADPLENLSEYSGEDFVNNVELGDSDISDDALTADE